MAKKKSKSSIAQIVLLIIGIVCSLAIFLPLFLNVWNGVVSVKNPITGKVVSESGALIGEKCGYFSDYSAYTDLFALADKTFNAWASTIAGIALIVALIGGVAFIIGAIMKMIGLNGKLTELLTKFGSIIMLVAGIVIVITSIIFIIPSLETLSIAFGVGAWIGMIAPLLAGILGLISVRK